MKEKWIRFMQGRYGADELGRYLLSVCLLLCLCSLFFRYRLCNLFALIFLMIYFARAFSRNIPRRYAENQKYLAFMNGLRGKIRGFWAETKQRRTHHIYQCPSCRQKIRIPKGHGKVEIRCPKCGALFTRKS